MLVKLAPFISVLGNQVNSNCVLVQDFKIPELFYPMIE